MQRFDVVVVGARCAGAPLAMMLARRGLSVCLLDRARFPSETPSTHIIQPCGAEMLQRFGLLDAVLAAGAARLEHVTLVNDDIRIDTAGEEVTQEYSALCIRRVTLDLVLVNAAAEAGADVRTGTRATGLVRGNGRVAGVETVAGPIAARLVVGADGRHSTVASAVGAAEYHVSAPGRMPAWAYFEGVPDQHGRAFLGRIGDLAYLASPTDGGLYMAAVTLNFAEQAEFHTDRNANFTAGIRKWPELAEVVGGARRVGPIRVVTDWHGYFRQSAGPGWVLVGDSGHFKDFTPGQGISDAFRQVERLATAIGEGAGGSEMDTAMQSWWRWRDADAYEMYWFASMMGSAGEQSVLTNRIMKVVADDPAATMTLFRVLNHEVQPSQLFTPRRILRVTGRAIRDEPRQMVSTLRELIATGATNVRQARQGRARPPGMSAPPWQEC